MARPRKHDGGVYKRSDSNFFWMAFRDKTGRRIQESTNTTDWDEAQQILRQRLAARDNNTLEVIKKGQGLSFNDWVEFFLEHYSKPPIRAAGTHRANSTALKNLRPVLGPRKLIEIDASMIEDYLRQRLS